MFRVTKEWAPNRVQRPHLVSMLFHEIVGRHSNSSSVFTKRAKTLYTNAIYSVECIFTGMKNGVGLSFCSPTY